MDTNFDLVTGVLRVVATGVLVVLAGVRLFDIGVRLAAVGVRLGDVGVFRIICVQCFCICWEMNAALPIYVCFD